jgi:hypothetical protein
LSGQQQIGSFGASPVYPLFLQQGVQTSGGVANINLDGVTDSQNNPSLITQIELAFPSSPANNIQVLFDAYTRPVKIIASTGQYITVAYGTGTQAVLTFCNSNGTPISTLNADTSTEQTSISTAPGSCQITITTGPMDFRHAAATGRHPADLATILGLVAIGAVIIYPSALLALLVTAAQLVFALGALALIYAAISRVTNAAGLPNSFSGIYVYVLSGAPSQCGGNGVSFTATVVGVYIATNNAPPGYSGLVQSNGNFFVGPYPSANTPGNTNSLSGQIIGTTITGTLVASNVSGFTCRYSFSGSKQ